MTRKLVELQVVLVSFVIPYFFATNMTDSTRPYTLSSFIWVSFKLCKIIRLKQDEFDITVQERTNNMPVSLTRNSPLSSFGPCGLLSLPKQCWTSTVSTTLQLRKIHQRYQGAFCLYLLRLVHTKSKLQPTGFRF